LVIEKLILDFQEFVKIYTWSIITDK